MQVPSEENQYQLSHAKLLRSSFARWLGRDLLNQPALDEDRFARQLFEAQAVVVSHNTDADPIFNYGNQAAMTLFELDWESFTQLPSRKSAEPMNRAERARLLAAVTEHNFIDDYSGLRISSTGKRFVLPRAIVWNLIDDEGVYRGQAATFTEWQFLNE